jgi:glutamyl-tRNA reductase
MDDLKAAMDENLNKRAMEALKAEEMIVRALRDFEKWYGYKSAVPVIREIRRFADEVIEDRTGHAFGKLRNAGEEERSIVRASMTSAVNEVLDKLVFSIRDISSSEDIQAYFRCLGEVMAGSKAEKLQD